MTGSGAAGGFSFQALVGGYVSSAALARAALNWLPNRDVPNAIAHEQGGAGDDCRIEFEDGSPACEVQVKRGLKVNADLEEALNNFVDRLAANEFGVLLVDSTSSAPVRVTLRSWLDRNREGIHKPIPKKLTKRCSALTTEKGLKMLSRLFVVELDLVHESAGHRMAALQWIATRLASGTTQDAAAPFDILANRSLKLMSEKGRLTRASTETLLKQRGYSLRDNEHIGNQTQRVGVPLRPLQLVGRSRDLEKLHGLLDGSTPTYLALVGTPGTGKSSLACQFAHETAAFDIVLWHDASTKRLLDESVSQSTQNCRFDQQADSHALLILDNAPAYHQSLLESLRPYDQYASLSILATTASATWDETFKTHAVGRLPRAATVELFSKTSAPSDEDDLRGLAGDIDDFPLAAAQLCAYVRKTNTSWSLVRERLRTQTASGFFAKKSSVLNSYEKTVAECWGLSFDELSEQAWEVLRELSLFDSRELPLDLWLEWREDAAPQPELDAPDESVAELFEWCLLERTSLGIECHGLLQRIVREHQTPEELEESATRCASMLFSFLGLLPSGSTFRTFIRLHRHISRFIDSAKPALPDRTIAELQYMYGNYLAGFNDYASALGHLRQAVSTARTLESKGETLLSHALNSLAVAELHLKDFDVAESSLKEALACLPDREGEEGRAAITDSLGQVAEGRGDTDKALALYRKALALRGGEDTATGGAAISLSNITKILIDQDAPESANYVAALKKTLDKIRATDFPWLPELFIKLARYFQRLNQENKSIMPWFLALDHARSAYGVTSMAYFSHAIDALVSFAKMQSPFMAILLIERSIGGELNIELPEGFPGEGMKMVPPLQSSFWFNGANTLVAYGYQKEGYTLLRRFIRDMKKAKGLDTMTKHLLNLAGLIVSEVKRRETEPPDPQVQTQPWPMAFALPELIKIPLPSGTPPPTIQGKYEGDTDWEAPARRGGT